jgi:hypothetical protein
MLAILTILVLITLGMLNANAFVSSRHPKLKDLVDKTSPYESYLGLVGILFGILLVLSSVTHSGMYAVLGLIAGLVTLALGILSAAGFLKGSLFQGSDSAQAKVDAVVAKLAVYQQNLGLGGIFLGIVYLFYILLGA